MSKFTVLLKLSPSPNLPLLQSLEDPEAERVWELYEEKTLEEIHLLDDSSGALLVMRGDRRTVQSAVESLPMVREKVLTPRYLGLVPWPEMTRMLRERDLPKPDWWATRSGD